MVNLSRPMEAPLDDGSCTLMGSLCFAGYEMGVDLYILQDGSDQFGTVWEDFHGKK